MAHTLTDGELEVIAELQEWDAQDCDEGEQPEYSGAWCHGCDNPVEECHCRTTQTLAMLKDVLEAQPA